MFTKQELNVLSMALRDWTGTYMCGSHSRKENAQAYRRLTESQKEYDRQVDPLCAYHEDFSVGCSCHISAPCSICTRTIDS